MSTTSITFGSDTSSPYSSGPDSRSSVDLSSVPVALGIITSAGIQQTSSPLFKDLEARLEAWCEQTRGEGEHKNRVVATQRILEAVQKKSAILNLSGLHLTSLPKDLGLLTGLETLHLNRNRLKDVSVLSGLVHLKSLSLQMNQIVDITPLQTLRELRTLYLFRNREISDISPLADLRELRRLYLNRTKISDLRPLRGLQELRELTLGGTRILNLRPLAELIHLEKLDLSRTSITNIEFIESLMRLQDLNLSKTQIRTIPPSLAQLGRGATVNASDTPLIHQAIVEFQQAIQRVRAERDDLGPEFILPYTADFSPYDMVVDLGFSSEARPKIIRPVHVTAPTMGPKLTTLLARLGAEPQEIDINFHDIDLYGLMKEVHCGIERLREKPIRQLSFPAALMQLAKEESRMYSMIRKIQLVAEEVVPKCDGLTLTGGPDIEPEFYNPAFKPTVSDFRRSIAEFALLSTAMEANKPVMGTCRGVQLVNVYFGGTLRQAGCTPGWETVELTESSKRAQLEALVGNEPLNIYSQHFQACDRIAPGFEVAMEHNGIPKLIMSEDDRVLGIQSHPECDENDLYSRAIQIYRIFFNKIKDLANRNK